MPEVLVRLPLLKTYKSSHAPPLKLLGDA